MRRRGLWSVSGCRSSRLANAVTGQENSHLGSNLTNMCLKSEVTCVQELYFGFRIIDLIRLRTGRDEERIILPPNG
jgi:hypothetical protein